MKELLDFEHFLEIEKKLEIKMGTIVNVERVPKSKKMLKLDVRFGLDTNDFKIVLTNIGDKIEPEVLLNKTLPFVVNLKPAMIMGIESQAMIIVGTKDENIDINLESGSKLF